MYRVSLELLCGCNFVNARTTNGPRNLYAHYQVKDEIEHLLDDSEDMAQLYLTRKMIQNFQYKALEAGASNSAITFPTNLQPLGSSIHSNMSFGTSIMYVGNDVEDLEMLLEAYFMQLEGTHNRILSVSPVLLLMDVTCSALSLDRYRLNKMLLF